MEKYRPLFIGGQWVEPADGATTADVDPATGETIAQIALGAKEDIDRAVAAAKKAYDDVWFDTPPRERSEMLLALADSVAANAAEFARLESIDVGKPIAVAEGEVSEAAACLRFFAAAARFPEGKSAGEYAKGYTSMIRREPLGVVAGICPWNYPLVMAVWKMGAALAAGNTEVLKPASLTPLTALFLSELAADILPAGVLNTVTGPGSETGDAICRHPQVRLVSVTGDTATGRLIAAACAETVKRCHLELGGKAPVVVFDDADLASVIEAVRITGYWNSGQDCTAACRVLAGPRIYDELLAALVPEVESIRLGAPMDPGVEMGPVVSEAHRETVKGFVDRSERAGATVCTGGEEVAGTGFYYKPTVIMDVGQKADIVQNEVFGPVVTVQRFTDEDEAVAMANDVIYGLASSVWTGDAKRALRLARRLQFGTVWINNHDGAALLDGGRRRGAAITFEMPHGGYKQSGYGKDLSMYSVEDYTQIKHVMAALE